MASLKAPLDIPMPDPAKEEAIRKKKEEVGFFFNPYPVCWFE